VEKVAAIEARGFIIGGALANALRCGFVPIRKSGKLPYKTVACEYSLEYGTDKVEMHEDAIAKGERILLVDDLLATGGTMGAAAKLVESLGGKIVGIAFFIELKFLKGRERLKKYNVVSLVEY
jgi:adenine phosphoribosyltransferase